MQIIKNSFVDCSTCKLYDCKSVIADTNCKHDLGAVDILIICENPGKDEVEFNKPICNEIFNKSFNAHLNDTNYFITNSVLCQTLKDDGSTGKPSKETIDLCKRNALKMVELCNPKLIFAIGKTACDILGMTGSITNNIGKITQYKDWDVLANIHPSYVEKQGGIDSKSFQRFDDVFKKANDLLNQSTTNQGESYMFSIDSNFYDEEYRLVDVQYIAYQQKLVFIFRDKENKKIFYEPIQKELNYYWYESLVEGDLIEKFEDLQLKTGNYKERGQSKNCYESDIKPDRKHACDYYMQSQGEAPITHQNIFYFDIEVYTYDHKGFPDTTKGEWPINAISFSYEGQPTEVFLLDIKDRVDKRLHDIKSKFDRLTLFNDERQLLTEFIKRMHSYEPDYIAGWNVIGFDMQYIYSRLKKLNINPKCMSPYGNVYIDGDRGICNVTGYIVLDQLWLYKELTYTNEPSYKLENICQKVLKKGKRPYTGSLNYQYENDIENLISYSFTDTDLLFELDGKLGHISLQNEIRQASATTHSAAMSTTGLADGLFNFEMKSKGYAMINAKHGHKETIPGAYVRESVGGLYDWVIDFDYTSLYPSIICSYNIGHNTYIAKVTEQVAHAYIYNREDMKDDKIEVIINPLKSNKIQETDFESFDEFMKKYNAIMSPTGCIYKGHDKDKSIFYPIIKTLFNQRKHYKNIMFEYKSKGDEMNTKMFNNKQMSYKILLNSLYGVMAQEHFRFYNLDLAATVTGCGRDLIKYAGEHCDKWMMDQSNDINPNYMTDVEKHKEYLRYCDTDSLFLWMKPYLEKKKMECNVENILKESRIIEDYLNNTLLTGYAEIHNIDLDESMFFLKNELVCKRYYSLNVKKKYALHVVNQEGVDTDEIEIKGLEIKRSDFSQITKNMLTELVDMLLKRDNVDTSQMLDYVAEIRAKAREMAIAGDPELYKTVAFSKKLEDYKTIPQHIRGMLIWNDLEYNHFQWGSRGVLIPIKAIEVFKAPQHVQDNYHNKVLNNFQKKSLDVIVIPEELPALPDYYIPDINRILQFAVDDRVDLLLEPLVQRNDDILTWD
jgi:uracil-DNA glycosylase family 4